MSKSYRLHCVVAVAVLLVACGPAPAAATGTAQQSSGAAGIEGTWVGHLTVPGGSLRIVFHVDMGEDGALSTTMDSPDQGAKGIPVSRTSFEDGKVVFESSSIGGVFEGTFKGPDGIEGEWKQSGMSFPLVLKRTEKIEGPSRPQEPKPPFPYASEEVSVTSGDGVVLAGTLTLPAGTGPWPAVLLITGSGPENRDEEVFGHKPFLVIADDLTRHGIAVLRMDDRGVGKSGGDFKTATEKDFVQDAQTGVAYLAGRKKIDGNAVGVLGHSEGGIIAQRLAARSKAVAFVILMESPGVPGERILLSQAAVIMKAMGVDQAAIDRELETNRAIFVVIKKESDDTVAAAKVAELLKKKIPGLDGMKADQRAAIESKMDAKAKALVTPWFREFLVFDPATALKQITCPVLATGGSLDLQVPAEENLAAISQALKEAGNQDVTIKDFKGLNHLLQPATTGLMSEYAQIETTISPDALEVIRNWIFERYRPGRPFGKEFQNTGDLTKLDPSTP